MARVFAYRAGCVNAAIGGTGTVSMKCAIHWFRRDLRLHDNSALRAALAAAETVVPVYILSDWKRHHHWTGPPRQQFLCGSLEVLALNLRKLGSRLTIRQGRADEEIEKLLSETGVEGIFFNRDPDPFGREMERKIQEMAQRRGIAVHPIKDVAIHERDEVLTGKGEPFRVFTPYARAWQKLPKPAPHGAPERIPTLRDIPTLPLPTLATWDLEPAAEIIEPGEDAARARLENFASGPLRHYAELRDVPSANGTSRLSQDLRFGLLSPRQVFARCARNEAFVNELIWREFYFQVLWHWPHVLEQDFDPAYKHVRWWEPGEAFERWQAGRTGFPIVDAGMRQLLATGFMHNRLRMITAMFLTKDLHIHWKHGEAHFMRHLVDGEIASNNGGWQWSAGTGADAAPYFRIQNPWTQTARYDADGAFIRKWVPELRGVLARQLSRPPEPGQSLAPDYPPPMVEHAREREITLAMFRSG